MSELTGRELAARLTGLVHAFLVGRLRAREVAAELRALAEWVEGNTRPARPVVEEVTTQVEQEIFQYWAARMKKPRARFGPERRKVVRARLREGYTADDIRQAIDGCAASGFHNGENESNHEYNDLLLICRNGAKLERFRDQAKAHGVKPLPITAAGDVEEKIERLAREARDALERGEVNAHNETQREIARLRASIGDVRSGDASQAARRAAKAG